MFYLLRSRNVLNFHQVVEQTTKIKPRLHSMKKIVINIFIEDFSTIKYVYIIPKKCCSIIIFCFLFIFFADRPYNCSLCWLPFSRPALISPLLYYFWNSVTSHPLQIPKFLIIFLPLSQQFWVWIFINLSNFEVFNFLPRLLPWFHPPNKSVTNCLDV